MLRNCEKNYTLTEFNFQRGNTQREIYVLVHQLSFVEGTIVASWARHLTSASRKHGITIIYAPVCWKILDGFKVISICYLVQ